jgi:hypothetical protein
MRPKGAKPEERRGKVLFINADAEFHAGRAQNYLRPEHIEKIVSTYHAFRDVPGYAAVVPVEEIEANDWNLNIRRYADNAPPPEPHDVRAHLVGGVPKVRWRRSGRSSTRSGWSRTRSSPSATRTTTTSGRRSTRRRRSAG